MWQRTAAGGAPKRLTLGPDGDLELAEPDPDYPEVVVRGRVRTHGDCRVLTLFLVNGQD
jgi:hypothetical protein